MNHQVNFSDLEYATKKKGLIRLKRTFFEKEEEKEIWKATCGDDEESFENFAPSGSGPLLGQSVQK